jgi:3-oxoacyl-[acyl-carrier protein] reductase
MDRAAVVTGSSRGIGEAVVKALRAAGWNTVSNGRASGRGPGHLHVRADVTRPAGARRLVEAARKRFGRIDLLVCAVGDFEYTPVSAMKIPRWEALFRSNLHSAWHSCRAALPLLRRRGGLVVTVGGAGTHSARGNPRAAAYQMSKTALVVFTRSLAQAEARRGVRVNMVSPGFIRTAAYTEKEVAEISPKIPAGRFGDPSDVARTILWLASEEASYVTGAVIDVGGGLWV